VRAWRWPVTAEKSHRFALTGQDSKTATGPSFVAGGRSGGRQGGAPGGAHVGRHDDHRNNPHLPGGRRGSPSDPGGGPVSTSTGQWVLSPTDGKAHRWLSPAPHAAPGGQPVPHPPAADLALSNNGHHAGSSLPATPVPRWARCPVDQQLHLLTPAQAEPRAPGSRARGRPADPPRGTDHRWRLDGEVVLELPGGGNHDQERTS
jgi:hypothetical protein